MSDEDIAWLDGYLKGILTGKEVNNATFNALLVNNLPEKDTVQSYIEFINAKDEDDVLDIPFPLLELSEGSFVNNWGEIITNHINTVFYETKDVQQRINFQILDMLDLLISDKPISALLCKGKVGDSHGDYLFFQVTKKSFLVLSFLYIDKKV
jgi:hypothetical protein